jgi:salicylate hydroxylase
VHTGFEVRAVEETARQVVVKDAVGRALAARVLVGADGLWSAVRRALWPQGAPQPAGAVAMRTVIAAERAAGLSTGCIGLWLSPTVHVVHYPVRAGREVAVVVIAREADARQGRGWDADVDGERLRHHLAPFHSSLTQALPPATAGAAAGPWRAWTLHTLPAQPGWVRGRIVLIGDAAHPMLPYLAQGGALALEDAVVLAAEMHAATDPADALPRFEAQRAARAHRVQMASVRQGRIYHLSPPLSWARDAVLRLAPPTWLMAGYDWLYGWGPPRAEAVATARAPGQSG